jgi:hypothetical protein
VQPETVEQTRADTYEAAAVYDFAEPLVVEQVQRQTLEPGQIRVQVEASGLCHTDIHAAHSDWPVRPTPPFVPGHEGIGIVSELGPGVTEVAIGERVAMPWLGYACGTCDYCVSGWETLCLEQKNMGYSIDGGFGEYATAYGRYVVKVPDGIALAVSPRSFEQAYKSLRRRGTLVVVALPADNAVTIPIFETVLNGITLVGSIVGTRATCGRSSSSTPPAGRRCTARFDRSRTSTRRSPTSRPGASPPGSSSSPDYVAGWGECRTRPTVAAISQRRTRLARSEVVRRCGCDRSHDLARLLGRQARRDVRLRDHSDQLLVLVDHGQTLDGVLAHQLERVFDRRVAANPDRCPLCELSDRHRRALAVREHLHDDISIGDDSFQAIVVAADRQGADVQLGHAFGRLEHVLAFADALASFVHRFPNHSRRHFRTS